MGTVTHYLPTNFSMLHSRLFIFASFLACLTIHVSAQEKKKIWQRGVLHTIDSMLTKRYLNAKTDTLYVVRPKSKWTIKGRVNFSGQNMYLRGTSKGTRYNALLHADFKTTLNISVGYLGLSLGFSVNPASWAGKYHDYEFNLNSYGNRWGVDLVYHNQQSAGGWLKFRGHDDRMDIEDGALLSKTLNVNAYLAFNHRRFSFPAAFSQSYIQRRSAGSWLLGFSLMGQWMEPMSETLQVPMNKYNHISIAIGAGYGYNFALKRKWLLHLSGIPTVAIWSNTETWNDWEWRKVPSHFPDVIIAGRAALVKNYRQNFMGISLVANLSIIGEPSFLQTSTSKWRFRIFYGWRF